MEIVVGYDKYGYATIDRHNPATSYDMSFKVAQGRGKMKFRSVLSDSHTLVYGAEALHYNLMPGAYLPYGEESAVTPKVLDAEKAVEGAAYIRGTLRTNSHWIMDSGSQCSIQTSSMADQSGDCREDI